MLLGVTALGVSSIVTQLVLMRELVSLFSGNELVVAVVLGVWLLATGLGARLGALSTRLRRPAVALVGAQLLVAFLPLVSLAGARCLRNVVFARGVAVGFVPTVLSTAVLLFPYCLVAGFVLTLACCLVAPRAGPAGLGDVYVTDNLGDILGGALYSFVLVFVCDHFGALTVPAVLNAFTAVVVAACFRFRILAIAAGAGGIGLLALLGTTDLERVTLERLYAGEWVVFHGHSPYGSVVVTELDEQLTFFEGGVPVFSTGDRQAVEQTVHVPMAERPHARRVLLISGAVSGTAAEILRYGVERVDAIELDPLVLEVAARFHPASTSDPRIHLLIGDARRHVERTRERYDVVIVDLPAPSTSQLNRFYTREFFAAAGRVLEPDGVLSFTLGSYDNYLSRELARLLSVEARTLREVFPNVLVLPLGRVHFLASKGHLEPELAGALRQNGLSTQWITPRDVEVHLAPDRVAELGRALDPLALCNRDFTPVAYYSQLEYWLSQQDLGRSAWVGALLLAGVVVWVLRSGAITAGVFAVGSAASSLEVVLLLGFQVAHGYVYRQLGVLVTAFIAGMALGAFAANQVGRRAEPLVSGASASRVLAALLALVAVFSACLPVGLRLLGGSVASNGTTWELVSAWGVFPFVTALLGALVGMVFPVAARAEFRGVGSTAARLYAADLVGASLGAALVSAVLVPVLGVAGVCGITAGTCLLTALWVRVAKNGVS